MHVRLTALLPILLAAGCATSPDKDPVQLRLNDLEARVARMERIVANEVQVSQNVDEMQGNLRELRGEIEELQHSSEIKGEGTDVVAAHAKYLAANPSTRVRLEGHTDERGSREYNIGLGERRAQAVRRALLLQGAADAQISTVSYGEERPAVPGHDEAAWAKNRRVEIVYLASGPAPKP